MIKLYIAAKLENHEQHNWVRDRLAPFATLTYDWTTHGSVKGTSPARTGEVADREMNGVERADAVIVLLPGGRGTHAELGMALAFGKPLGIYSPNPRHFEVGPDTCAFYWPDGVYRTGSLEDLIAWVVRGGRERQAIDREPSA